MDELEAINISRNNSLWNLNNKKCFITRVYINSLKYRPYWESRERYEFDKIIMYALNQSHPNAMLEIIGYNFKGFDDVYRLAEL